MVVKVEVAVVVVVDVLSVKVELEAEAVVVKEIRLCVSGSCGLALPVLGLGSCRLC